MTGKTPSIQTHRYANGLTLLVEPMPSVASAGMTLLVPAGAAYQPVGQFGVATILNEMLFRGAGDLDAKAHSDALDRLGVHRSSEVQTYHMRIGATFMGERLESVLPLMFDAVRRPQMTDASFEPAVELALQSLESLEDNPQEKVMIEVKRRHLGEPLGRSVLGETADLEALSAQQVRDYWKMRMVPQGAILGVAGAVKFEQVRDAVGKLLGDWSGKSDIALPVAVHVPGYHHLTAETTQEHIGLAYSTVGAADEDASAAQRIAAAVLSGGMSGRLFTEVRENRGLCYSVYASYVAQKQIGSVYAYAGSTVQRAGETLEVLSAELKKMSAGVARDEFQRAVIGLKARLVMQGESTTARASAIAYDQFLLGRPHTLAEMAAQVDSVSLEQLNRFVAEHPAKDFTTVTIGPEPLKV